MFHPNNSSYDAPFLKGAFLFKKRGIGALAFFIFLNIIFVQPCIGQDVFIIDPSRSAITCDARYVVLGRYEAVFNDFTGKIYFSPDDLKTSYVIIEIDVNSIKSEHPRLDSFAKSKRLMDAAKYPKAVFKSSAIYRDGDKYIAKGELDFHGVKKTISFPFEIEGPYVDYSGKTLVAKGEWPIKRKRFDIAWSKLLDHGGIIVSDVVKVKWEVLGLSKEGNQNE